jgi:hypothetical protein
MGRKRSRRDQPRDLQQRFQERDPKRRDSDDDESGGHLEAEEAEEPAPDGRDETLGKNAADFRFEGGEIALVRMEAGSDDAAAGYG